MRLLSDGERDNLLNNYFNEYGDSYTIQDINKIKKDFGSSYESYFTQIYYALGLLSDEENPYLGFVDIIEQVFGLDINILEVGGGVYPALSEVIARKQMQIGKGRITVYDGLLSKNLNINGVHLVKKMFSYEDDVNSYDLIIGKEPCSAINIIVNKSVQKNLLLSPCRCYSLLPEYMEYANDPLKQWYSYVEAMIKDCKTHYLDSNKHYEIPIYTKKYNR